MNEQTTSLPDKIGEWLASGDPARLAQAEVALQAAEPDANDLLLERAEKERKNHRFIVLSAFFVVAGHPTIRVQNLEKCDSRSASP